MKSFKRGDKISRICQQESSETAPGQDGSIKVHDTA